MKFGEMKDIKLFQTFVDFDILFCIPMNADTNPAISNLRLNQLSNWSISWNTLPKWEVLLSDWIKGDGCYHSVG